ncbi:Chloroplast inner envelope protein [Corchorus olitorius]|uniref:Chloroplast inner envelope protein n=1 Tax=Corchorus olitorius TaxID=93759 RepID=A0A1R3KJ55_9ROSI|nr:Chloroplast inner envelope protein [Corchorus olitorius]
MEVSAMSTAGQFLFAVGYVVASAAAGRKSMINLIFLTVSLHEQECLLLVGEFFAFLGNIEDGPNGDVVVDHYNRYLSGDLEMADSNAAFLQNLCEELHFDPQKASEIHEEIYHKRLQQCVADGELDDKDVSELLKVRKIFRNYVKRSRSAENRTESAKELKKMIAFNTLVVAYQPFFF